MFVCSTVVAYTTEPLPAAPPAAPAATSSKPSPEAVEAAANVDASRSCCLRLWLALLAGAVVAGKGADVEAKVKGALRAWVAANCTDADAGIDSQVGGYIAARWCGFTKNM